MHFSFCTISAATPPFLPSSCKNAEALTVHSARDPRTRTKQWEGGGAGARAHHRGEHPRPGSWLCRDAPRRPWAGGRLMQWAGGRLMVVAGVGRSLSRGRKKRSSSSSVSRSPPRRAANGGAKKERDRSSSPQARRRSRSPAARRTPPGSPLRRRSPSRERRSPARGGANGRVRASRSPVRRRSRSFILRPPAQPHYSPPLLVASRFPRVSSPMVPQEPNP